MDRLDSIEERTAHLIAAVDDLSDIVARQAGEIDTLTRRVHAAIGGALGAERVRPVEPVMAGEDFSEFGRTAEKVPLCLFWLGAVDPVKFAEYERTGAPLPSLHSSKFAPLPEPTIRTGIAAMSAAALDLLGKK